MWILGVSLFIVIGLGILALWLIYRKLKQHEVDIAALQDVENALRVKHDNNNDDRAIQFSGVFKDSDTDSVPEIRQVSVGSSLGEPRISVFIHAEEANVYGCTPHMSQVMMIAQECHKATTKEDKTVPPESVRVFDRTKKSINRVSNYISDDWQNGRPNSIMFTSQGKPLEDRILDNKGVFVHKTIDKNGGRLEVSGVTLSVPEGALDSSTLLTVGVIWEKKYYPALNKKQSLLSPIILCQPCGVKFNTDVRLTIPHCAANIKDDWNISIMRRSGDLSEPSSWERTDADTIKQSIDTNQITLDLRHFTLYTCIGESKENKVAAKAIHLVAFVSQLMSGALFKPRIYCINNYRQELQV